MIVRDGHGIIVQHDPNDASYMDGGDSAARVGIMAAFQSPIDLLVIKHWEKPCRHPFQAKWSEPKDFSRDQWTCWMAGFWAAGRVPPNPYKYFVNKDILLPDHWLHAAICSGTATKLHYLLGYPVLWLSVMWASYVRPGHELNQLACQCVVAGNWWLRLLVRHHPNYNKNFTDYYGGWRDQPDMSTRILLETSRRTGG